MWRVLKVLCLLGFLTACQSIVPASSPPQLNHTPSAPITITESRIESDWFTLNYPDNWRVVTNIAIEPLHLIIVSPDDSFLIHIEDARNGCEIEAIGSVLGQCIGEDDAQLSIWGEQISELEAEYDLIFEQVVNSVKFR